MLDPSQQQRVTGGREQSRCKCEAEGLRRRRALWEVSRVGWVQILTGSCDLKGGYKETLRPSKKGTAQQSQRYLGGMPGAGVLGGGSWLGKAEENGRMEMQSGGVSSLKGMCVGTKHFPLTFKH